VHVWVLRPPGGRRRRGPAVLEIHGGPHVQYGHTFFHEFQVLAGRGYTVFYGNPRGSKGYGEAHSASIRGRWGTVDWEDVQAVVRFVQSRPYVDPRRLGVIGGSYGGYMTNWAIAHSDAFAAAVTDRSVSNLLSMWGTSDVPAYPGQYWRGAAWRGAEELWEQSPIRCFDRVRTPTLVLHAEGDLRCNIEQAEQVFTALRMRGVAARLVRYPPTASHGMSRSGPPDLRVLRLEHILDWWRRHLG
jgi:acylaminoacyl-peptidase